jgi:hypothetical protein
MEHVRAHLDVTVHYILLMQILDCLCQLEKDEFYMCLL